MNNAVGYLRWYAKKAARKGVALGAWSTKSVLSRDGAARSRVRVLTYHRFGHDAYDPFCVTPETFEEQMRTLAESGLAVSLADVEAFVMGRGRLADGSVLVTIDDGFHSVYSRALPILRCFEIPAVLYVPAGCIEAANGCTADAEPRLSWNEMTELARAGVAIGSHAWSHRSLGTMTADEVRTEAERSRRLLQDRIGAPVTSFAYPFGTRADFNDVTAAILLECGYTTAFTSQHGALTPGIDPLELPRVKVESGEGLWMFRLLIRGGLDGWQWVDRTLWRLQANHGGGLATAS